MKKEEIQNIINSWSGDADLTIQDAYLLGNIFFRNYFDGSKFQFEYKKKLLEITFLEETSSYEENIIAFLEKDTKYSKIKEEVDFVNSLNDKGEAAWVYFKLILESNEKIEVDSFWENIKGKVDSQELYVWFLRGNFDSRGSYDGSSWIASDIGKSNLTSNDEYENRKAMVEYLKKSIDDWKNKIDLEDKLIPSVHLKGKNNSRDNDQLRIRPEFIIDVGSLQPLLIEKIASVKQEWKDEMVVRYNSLLRDYVNCADQDIIFVKENDFKKYYVKKKVKK